MKYILLTIILALAGLRGYAKASDSIRTHDLISSTVASIETSVTAASGSFAPLWLTSNRYGLASVEPSSNYERAALGRDIHLDDAQRWGVGYAVDVAVALSHTRRFVLNQAYVEGRYRKLGITLGAKQQPMETKNLELTSGGLSLGANARAIPQARLDIDWFGIPGTHGWWQWKLYGSYGITTDGRWQASWAGAGERYTRHVLYHEKALYWRFGRTDVLPLTYEFGLQMASQFGGTTYNGRGRGYNTPTTFHHPTGLRAFWNALTCQGSDQTDGLQPNTAGNTLGSYIMELRYHGTRWQASAYFERFFEDQSMLTVQYGIRDMLIGAAATLPNNRIVTKAALEFVTTTNQSGAVYHDRSPNIHDKMNGRDDYYNHNLYAGWQHYGLTLGNPLLTSPLYNEALGRSHTLRFYNNRVKAWHIAFAGDPSVEWHWRALLTLTRNWGTYSQPLPDCLRQTYALAEATYKPRWTQGWQATLGIGLDHGKLLGNSVGGQLTVTKRINLKN
ncbi:MAG: hypothetical protein IJ209_02515 [Bacteroidaceae bacterium]|nr:hypothetical protein [Bacteroidaceae bacterium]